MKGGQPPISLFLPQALENLAKRRISGLIVNNFIILKIHSDYLDFFSSLQIQGGTVNPPGNLNRPRHPTPPRIATITPPLTRLP